MYYHFLFPWFYFHIIFHINRFFFQHMNGTGYMKMIYTWKLDTIDHRSFKFRFYTWFYFELIISLSKQRVTITLDTYYCKLQISRPVYSPLTLTIETRTRKGAPCINLHDNRNSSTRYVLKCQLSTCIPLPCMIQLYNFQISTYAYVLVCIAY